METTRPVKKPYAMSTVIVTASIVLVMIGAIIWSVREVETAPDMAKISTFATIFMSILMEAFPFILIGVFVSSAIHIFVPSEAITKLFSKSKFVSFFVAIFAGVAFPVCDCAIVPVAIRFIKKGIPPFAVVTFMLAAPIVNPVVIISTLYAFPDPMVAVCRTGIGILIAALAGCVFLIFPEKTSIVRHEETGHCHEHDCCAEHGGNNSSFINKIGSVFSHAAEEFFDVGRFVIIGAAISSIAHTMVPTDIFEGIGGNNAVAVPIMMLTAYVLSMCATSDAFVAQSFSAQFSISPLIAFMVFGQMLDIKNTLILSGNFKKSFVLKLVTVTTLLCFSIVYFITPLIIK